MKNDQALLNQIAQHITLTEEEQMLLLSKLKRRKYLKGQFVVQEGDVCRYSSFVLSGCLKSFHLDEEGSEHIVAFAIENWWTGDLRSFITQTPAFFNIQCIKRTALLQLSYQDLEQLYIDIPKLERYFRILIQNAYVNSQKRIIDNFSLTAKEKYLQFRDLYPTIHQQVPQYMIASYLGITPEFLSRIRKKS